MDDIRVSEFRMRAARPLWGATVCAPHLIFSYCTSGSKSRSSTQTDSYQVSGVWTQRRSKAVLDPETKTRLCVNVIVIVFACQCQCQCQCQPECVALIHGTRMDGVMDMPATRRNRPDGSLSSRKIGGGVCSAASFRQVTSWHLRVPRHHASCIGSCVLRSASLRGLSPDRS